MSICMDEPPCPVREDDNPFVLTQLTIPHSDFVRIHVGKHKLKQSEESSKAIIPTRKELNISFFDDPIY